MLSKANRLQAEMVILLPLHREAGFQKEFDRNEHAHSKPCLLSDVGEVLEFKLGGMQVDRAIAHAL